MDALSYAYGTNHFDRDRDLKAVLRDLWANHAQHWPALGEFGALAGGELYESLYHIDHDARPVLVAHNLDGERIDRVRLSPSERQALEKTAWIMGLPYHGESWLSHYALLYLIGDPGLGCILTITQQTAYALHKYGQSIPGQARIVEDLISGRAWGATWMTESQGGSDLGANQATAREDGPLWRISGDKYFASGAGLADYAIVTARPEGGAPGPKGLGLFLLPRIGSNGQLNYHVRRLKDKSATRAVPSGEVELQDAEAYLIGEAGRGIYYTLENLTVSRLANAAAAMGVGKKAHLEVLGRVHRRHSFGAPLIGHPLIRRDLTDLAVRAAGGTALAFHSIAQFDGVWEEKPPFSARYHRVRFWSHLAKNRTAEHSAAMTQMAMELFGGLGFLEEYAVARWHREALITPIWEGPSNIQALDFLESVQRQHTDESFWEEMTYLLSQAGTAPAREALDIMERTLVNLRRFEGAEAQWMAKESLRTLADVAQVALLYRLAEGQGERYAKLAALYHARFLNREEYPFWAYEDPDIWDEASSLA